MTIEDRAQRIHLHYRMLKAAQKRFGLARFEMGVLLHLIKEEDLWQGKAESFKDLLQQERINETAARQYMRVARRLYFDLQFTDAEFEALVDVNMSTLDKACPLINQDNKDEMLAMLSTLEARDAKHELNELVDPSDHRKQHPKVAKILSDFRDLPHELRIEMLSLLSMSPNQSACT